MKFTLTEDDLCLVLYKALQASPEKDSLEISILNKSYSIKLTVDKIEQKFVPKIIEMTPVKS